MSKTNKRTELSGEITDGVLTISGAEGRWHQRTSRALYVEVSELRLHQNISVDEGSASRIERLVGKGDLHRDSLRLAGWGDVCSDLWVTVRPALPQEDGNGYVPFSCAIGFIPASDDFRTGDRWFFEAWLPPEDIHRMVAAYRAGEMREFTLGASPDLWILDGDEYTPPGYGVTWHLVPMTGRASEFPETGRGEVRLITWGEPAREDTEQTKPPASDVPPAVQRRDEQREVESASGLAPDLELVEALERLRRAFVWIGSSVAAALIVGWFT